MEKCEGETCRGIGCEDRKRKEEKRIFYEWDRKNRGGRKFTERERKDEKDGKVKDTKIEKASEGRLEGERERYEEGREK